MLIRTTIFLYQNLYLNKYLAKNSSQGDLISLYEEHNFWVIWPRINVCYHCIHIQLQLTSNICNLSNWSIKISNIIYKNSFTPPLSKLKFWGVYIFLILPYLHLVCIICRNFVHVVRLALAFILTKLPFRFKGLKPRRAIILRWWRHVIRRNNAMNVRKEYVILLSGNCASLRWYRLQTF